MKKILFIVFIFLFMTSYVFGYEVGNSNDKYAINNDIDEIFSLKEMYEELAGISDDEDYDIFYEIVNSDDYWWPIGSAEVSSSDGVTYALGEPESARITSTFGYRGAIYNSAGQLIAGNENHGALDIAPGRGVGVTNVIAAKSGVVIYPKKSSITNCTNADSRCYGYGNYVVISHSDGNFTLYAHLHANSISVKEGDSVDQGQVIAKVGNSGNSTGPHLHFEVRLGENSIKARVDPLTYVNQDNPRPIVKKTTSTSSLADGSVSFEDLIKYVETWEGTGCGDSYQTDTEYIACMGNDNVITIGHGVVWESNKDKFRAHGVNNVSIGTHVSKKIVDDIEVEVMMETYDDIKRDLALAGIDGLKDYQIMALVSQSYNGGYTVIKNNTYGYDFITNYKKYNGKYDYNDIYKHEGSLWYDSMCRPYSPGSANELGLQRRRVSEWKLFNTGEIDFMPLSSFNPGDYAWPE